MLWQLAVRFGDIILIFFLSWLIAFALNPLARFLCQTARMPRPLAVAIIYLALILVLVVAGLLFLPTTVQQLIQLGRDLPTYVGGIPTALNELQAWLANRGVEVNLASVYQSQTILQRAETLGTALAQNALSIAQGVVSLIVNVIIIVILSFYMMLDGERIQHSLFRLLPERVQDEARYFFQSIDRTFGGWIRSAFIQAVIYGIGTAIVMKWANLSFILVASVFAGLMMIIPFVGTFLAMIPPLGLAIATGSTYTIIVVFVALLVLQQIIINIVAPKLMSEGVGMHPLLVFLAMLLGARVAGVWGAVFGVPVVAVAYSMFIYLVDRNEARRLMGMVEEGLDAVDELALDHAGLMKEEQTE
jgi:predicted PurR-regulated permease PerM